MNIDYLDEDEWRKFIKDYILPLKASADALCDYWNYLRSEINSTRIDEMGDDFKTILLGGTDEKGNYSDGSIAKLYRDLFGISLNVELPKYIEAVKVEATEGIRGAVREEDIIRGERICYFIKFILDTARQAGKIVNIASYKLDISIESSRINYEELLKNPDALLDLLCDFYNKCAELAPNYNEYTAFLLCIRFITRGYFEKAYSQLKDNFDELRSLLGLETLFEPCSESKKRDEYTIWHFPENSLGGEILRLCDIIWDCSSDFKDLLSQYFEGFVDLKGEFLREAGERASSFTTEIARCLYSHGGIEFGIEGEWVVDYVEVSYRNLVHGITGYGNRIDINKALHIFSLIDEIIPPVFTGYIDIRRADHRHIEFERRGDRGSLYMRYHKW